MMRVLVTGAAGFIGANLLDRLHFDGHQGIGLDDFSGSHIGNVDTPSIIVQNTFGDRSGLTKLVQEVDAVVHLAGFTGVGPSIKQPEACFKCNVNDTFHLLEVCRQANDCHVILASSAGTVCGESHGKPLTEDTTPRPKSPYGASKLGMEQIAEAYNHSYDMNITTLRFSNVYGPRSIHKQSLITNLMKAAKQDIPALIYGDGSAVRDYVYVEDVCNAIMKTLNYKSNGVLNIASGESHSVSEIVEAVQDVTGKRIESKNTNGRKGEVSEVRVSTAKACEELDYFPEYGIREGLEKTWEWFLHAHV